MLQNFGNLGVAMGIATTVFLMSAQQDAAGQPEQIKDGAVQGQLPQSATPARQISPAQRSSFKRPSLNPRGVGCFDAHVVAADDGFAYRYAMSGFVAHVNATLLFEETDHELRSLLLSKRTQVCGLGCTAGLYTSAERDCQPVALSGGGPNKLLHKAQRDILTRTSAQAPVLPVVRGVITPMAAMSAKSIKAFRAPHIVETAPQPVTRRSPVQKVSTVVRKPAATRLRVLPPATTSRARSKRGNRKNIARRTAARLRQGGGAQVGIRPYQRRYDHGRKAKPPKTRLPLLEFFNALGSGRARAAFWRRLEREAS